MTATGLNDFLWRSLELLTAKALWLNALLCSDSTLRSGWESLSRIEQSLNSIFLSVTATRGSNVTRTDPCPPSVGVRYPTCCCPNSPQGRIGCWPPQTQCCRGRKSESLQVSHRLLRLNKVELQVVEFPPVDEADASNHCRVIRESLQVPRLTVFKGTALLVQSLT